MNHVKIALLALLALFLDASAYAQVPTNPLTLGITDARYCALAGCSMTGPLKITNSGTNDSFLVEDSVSTDTSPTLIDASGNFVTGTTAAQAFDGATTPRMQIVSSSATDTSTLGIQNWSSTVTNAGTLRFAKARGQSIGTHTVVSTSDVLGTISFAGSDGTAFIPAASIRVGVGTTPGTNDMPGKLIFATTADGAASVTDRLVINHDGSTITPSGTIMYMGAAGGTTDALTFTPTTALTAYTTGAIYLIRASATNTTTTPTANISALGAKTIVKRASTALAAGDIVNGALYWLTYNGTNLQILNPTVN